MDNRWPHPSRSLAILLSFGIFAPASLSYAGGAGTTAATFLQLGYGARPIGSAEAFVPVANDVSALYYNPAGLAYPAAVDPKSGSGPYEILASHALLVQDIRLTQAGFVRRPFGLSLTYLSLGGIEQRTAETAEPDGKTGASDLALGVSYGRKVNGVGLGVTGRYIRESIAGFSASAIAMDLGLLHRLEKYPLSFGLSIANLGPGMRFIDQTYPLPAVVRAGVTYGLSRDFPHALTLQIDAPRDSGPAARFGLEYLGFGPIALRAGYRTYGKEQRAAALGTALGSTASSLSEFYGLFLGAGLRTPFGNLDYALVPYGELGTAHRVSFSMNFGEGARKATP
ncbi:MAG: hypothetical protein A2506_02930 [Elusimicrobia bacterium RIFOXYD12_FULL_66_9]|nr:MAG: hypothetical protein A2506_02930 [Elusimicrobia bacterium RIFOXYD12_FULL_66_9]